MTKLDESISKALRDLRDRSSSSFDVNRYIQDFRPSAKGKAEAVVSLLNEHKSPLFGLRPIFVSIGGGDGEELDYLLRNTTASTGVLVEMTRELAEIARDRKTSLPQGKRIVVFEGDAKEKIDAAMEFAHQIVLRGEADYVAATCHAVIHELFDRGKAAFDPVSFFATIFRVQLYPHGLLTVSRACLKSGRHRSF